MPPAGFLALYFQTLTGPPVARDPPLVGIARCFTYNTYELTRSIETRRVDARRSTALRSRARIPGIVSSRTVSPVRLFLEGLGEYVVLVVERQPRRLARTPDVGEPTRRATKGLMRPRRGEALVTMAARAREHGTRSAISLRAPHTYPPRLWLRSSSAGIVVTACRTTFQALRTIRDNRTKGPLYFVERGALVRFGGRTNRTKSGQGVR
jgi:hypothetical protein